MIELKKLPKCPVCYTTKKEIGVCPRCKDYLDTEDELIKTFRDIAREYRYNQFLFENEG